MRDSLFSQLNRTGSNGNFNSIKSDDPNIFSRSVDEDSNENKRIYSQSEKTKKF
jgi:hypothetical protein